MSKQKQITQASNLYLILAGLFIASLVSCNLIFQKFFAWTPLPWLSDYTFELSVGIIPYPITFLITDMISEIFGRKKANQVVVAGLVSAVFVLLIVMVSQATTATVWSPVSDSVFSQVFGLTGVAVGASMAAYLIAQLVDVRLFHFWKKVTKGEYLWIRNNFSTVLSQLVDTSTVLLLLCATGAIQWNLFWVLFLNGFLFKVLVAAIDTPFFYLLVYWARKKFSLKPGEEIKI